jgi:hypothetical protein
MNPNMTIQDRTYLDNLSDEQLLEFSEFLYSGISSGMEMGQLGVEVNKIIESRKPTYRRESWYQCFQEFTACDGKTWLRYNRIDVMIK